MFYYYCFIIGIILLAGRYRIPKFGKSRNKSINLTAVCFLIILFAAFRFNVGFDWKTYLSLIYPNYSPKRIGKFEPLSLLYMKIAGSLNAPALMFFLFSLTIYGFVALAIYNNSVDWFESIVIYIALFYFDSLSIMRQAASSAITFYAYKYIKRKQLFKYILFCLIAFLYHKSAIIAIPLYSIYYTKRKNIFILLASVLVMFKIILPRIIMKVFPVFIYYYNTEVANNSGNFVRLFNILLLFYCLFFYKKDDTEAKHLLNICIIGSVIPFVLGGHTGGRIAQSFLIYYVFLLPLVNRKFKITYRILFLIPFYIYFFLLLWVGGAAYVPYKLYFWEDLSSLHLQ